MRILKFNINGQNLSKDPSCDFTNIISGSKGYLYCKFTFDKEWDSYKKVVRFTASTGRNGFYQLDENDGCNVPDGISEKGYFIIRLYGVKGEEQFKTNKVLVRQERG